MGQLVIVRRGNFYVHTIGQNLDDICGIVAWAARPTYRVENSTIGLVLSNQRRCTGRGDYNLVLVNERILEVDLGFAKAYENEV